jgi:hypothetical protein
VLPSSAHRQPNVVPLTEAAFIGSENVAVTFTLGSTPVAALAG